MFACTRQPRKRTLCKTIKFVETHDTTSHLAVMVAEEFTWLGMLISAVSLEGSEILFADDVLFYRSYLTFCVVSSF